MVRFAQIGLWSVSLPLALLATSVSGQTHDAVAQDRAASRAAEVEKLLAETPEEELQRYLADGAAPDSTGTGGLAVIKHVLPTLPDHVVYQPADMAQLGDRKMPIYVFGNGACTKDGASSRQHLIEIASHGYLAIAPGGIHSGPGIAMSAELREQHRVKTTYRQLGEAIDWAVAENARQDSPFFNRIATDKVAVSGYSCGGIQALKYAGDPRVATFVIMNSGLMPEGVGQIGEMAGSKSLLDRLTVPTIYVMGGPSDIAWANGIDDFGRIANAPVALASIDVTHEGTYNKPNGGEAAAAVVAWLDWQLRGDKEAKKAFVGDDCRLCADPDWTVTWRNEDKL